jgi:ornithine cyclodeaminase
MDAGELTAIRTAAAAGLATRLLSRPDSRVLAVFGAGAQAPRQIEAVRAVRPIEEVRIVSREGASARTLARRLDGVEARAVEDPAEAVEGADVIVAATTSMPPVFRGADLRSGVHVNGAGSFKPSMQEVDVDVVRRARVVVEDRTSALEEAGDLIIPIGDGTVPEDVIDCELGEIVRGEAPEGAAGRELTFFKSVGTAVQDVAIGGAVLDAAIRAGVGTLVSM